MKREVRLPTKGYDILRQQVQAKRGSPTNRMLPDESLPADIPDIAADRGAVERIVDLSATVAGGGSTTHTTAAKPAESEVSDSPTKQARRPTERTSEAHAGESGMLAPPPMGTTDRITLKINLTAPAVGVFQFYDRVIETMSPRKAVPLLLAKAFEELEASAIRGDKIRFEEYKMERNGERISTSRTMDYSTLTILRESFDPHKLMRMSSLGTALATSALSIYLRTQAELR